MTTYEPPVEAVDVLARHMAHVALDWTDVERGEHEHSLECANWRAYIADARRALTAAGPIIAEGAWDEGVQAGLDAGLTIAEGVHAGNGVLDLADVPHMPRNPYQDKGADRCVTTS